MCKIISVDYVHCSLLLLLRNNALEILLLALCFCCYLFCFRGYVVGEGGEGGGEFF